MQHKYFIQSAVWNKLINSFHVNSWLHYWWIESWQKNLPFLLAKIALYSGGGAKSCQGWQPVCSCPGLCSIQATWTTRWHQYPTDNSSDYVFISHISLRMLYVWCLIVCFNTDQDGAEPSPNSSSTHNLQRLSGYLAGKLMEAKAVDIYKTFGKMLNDHPVAVPEMLSAFIFHSQPPKQVCNIELHYSWA